MAKNVVEGIRDRWKTRRRMTWIVLVSFVAFIAYCTTQIVPADLKEYTLLITSVTSFATFILGGYFGFATYDDVKNREVAEPPDSEEDCEPEERGRGRRRRRTQAEIDEQKVEQTKVETTIQTTTTPASGG